MPFDAIELVEDGDYISLCVYADNPELSTLGERIHQRHPAAYMNGYNWQALIHHYVETVDPELIAAVEPDPEAGMYTGVMAAGDANLEAMRRLESLVRDLIGNEAALFEFIDTKADTIAWD